MRRILPIALLGTLGFAPAAHAAGDDAIDASIYFDHMRVLTDGKGHYVALMPFTMSDGEDEGYLFYSGDGKTFYAQRRSSGSRDGNNAFENDFWDPRASGDLSYRDKKYTITCGKQSTELQVMERAKGRELLGAAKFMKPRWKRHAVTLARDNSGVYYYVDQAREPEENRDYRVFRGQKGALKEQKMVNIVSDSEGQIFVTKTGKLRLVLDKHETSWIEGKAQTKLTMIDLDASREAGHLIYTELGVYTGQPLGTPCDDF